MWSDPDVETVLPGVHRVPLPLPGDALKAVNVYALEEPDGLTLIDSGWGDATSWERLAAGLAPLGAEVGDIRRVLVTHVHLDHVGQATALKRHAGARIYIGKAERPSYEAAVSGPTVFRQHQAALLVEAGADELAATLMEAEHEPLDWDDADRWISPDETIPAGARLLEAIYTPGHTKGHTGFVDAGRRLLFSGDHVLPHITPSIGFESYPTRTALADFLTSLARVRELPVDLVLPAHGPVFPDLARRVDELVAHHDSRLSECASALSRQGTTAYQVAQLLGWTRREVPFTELTVFNRVLATRETLAHLYLLESRGSASRDEVGAVSFFRPLP